MLATLDNILSPVWTLSLNGGGAIAEGMEAIKQCLNVIVRTTKGTDPLRPEFGCDLYKFADQPINTAIPNMKKAMLEAIGRWEPRVKVNKITHSLGDPNKGQIDFNLGYSLTDETLTDSLAVSVGSGGVSTGISRKRMIMRTNLPMSGIGLQYQVYGQVDGVDILPLPPSGGFAEITDLYNWIQSNWGNYGQWYVTGDSLVVYFNPVYISGRISISLLSVRQVLVQIPTAFDYTIMVNLDGTPYTNSTELDTPGAILQYLTTDPILGLLGTWQIVSTPASFNDDFGEDYNTYDQALQLITSDSRDIQISIIAN